MTKPLVSFIIPVFNGERDIARCLLSIRNLEVPEDAYEVVIMDNGSTDGTPQIVRDLGFDLQVMPKVHVSVLRNHGAARVRGAYLAFVDADMELAPSWLQSGLEGFKDPGVVVCGCYPSIPNEATWVQRTWDVHRRCRQSADKLTPVSWLGSANLIVRRDDFLAVGGFNEQLETAEDVDLCYRLGQRGVILCNLAIEAIHWGEDPDLQTFWRKEIWRGRGNLKGLLSHGLRWDELPSLGYPFFVICVVLLFGLGCVIDLWRQQIMFAPWCLILLVLPPLLLALNTTRLARRPGLIPKLFMLYFIYGLARAFSVVKVWLPWRS